VNFLQKLIKKLAQQVFNPVSPGILYTILQCITREISGDCPWDNGDECGRWKKESSGIDTSEVYTSYWKSGGCRNFLCPGYTYPTGLISYTSRAPTITGSILASSFDNVFDYSSFRQYSSILDSVTGLRSDEVPVGTYGAKIKINFDVPFRNVKIGDKWTISCTALTGLVGLAVADASNEGTYGIVQTSGIYTGKYDTVYTVEITDFWGYSQNYNNALLQISLLTATGYWLNYWGSYFGIPRLLLFSGYETDDIYRARIIKEITLARTTKAVLLDLAKDYLGSDDVTITEYEYADPGPPGWDEQDITGLMPFEFYINLPYQERPSSLFVKAGSNFLVAGSSCYSFDVGTGVFTSLTAVGLGSFFPAVPVVGDAFLIGSIYKFSGVEINLSAMSSNGVTIVFEYWNGTNTPGSEWTTLTVTDTTGGPVNPFTADGRVNWVVSDTWKQGDNVATHIPNTGTSMYWIRCRISAGAPAVVPVSDTVDIVYAGATCRGHYIGAIGTYNDALRDKNNCYIYELGVFANQGQYTGLQQIIDRNKAAGTICIINTA
jgi:hypothetical protein